jgi:hypothetical protein
VVHAEDCNCNDETPKHGKSDTVSFGAVIRAVQYLNIIIIQITITVRRIFFFETTFLNKKTVFLEENEINR